VAGAALKKAQAGALSGGEKVVGQTTPYASSKEIAELQAGASYGYQFSSGWNVRDAIGKYYQLQAANSRLKPIHGEVGLSDKMARKGMFALEAAVWYNTHLKGQEVKWEHIPGMELGRMIGLEAGDNTDSNDPGGSLGILSGSLVLQRTLPVFKYKYPELLSMYTDFSDNPGVYQQTEVTRIVTQPATQKYSTTTDNTGRPAGWSTVSSATTTDVTISLTDYIAVPIALGNQVIAATTRRLFDEQAVLAVAAIAGYLTTMVTNLLTASNYNYYATVNGTLVPTAYTTYKQTAQSWGMSDLDTLDSIFTSAKVPEEDRGILLNPTYYSKLRGDPRLEFFYAASSRSIGDASDFVTEAKLPKLSGFAPYKAGYMPTSTPSTNPTTNNVVGFAYQKAGILLKSRLPTDFTTALNTMIPGSVTTVTDPDTKISLMLVQYVNLTQNYAEWRPEVMLGASKADNRAGLVITSS
jgi:hypothetical protein